METVIESLSHRVIRSEDVEMIEQYILDAGSDSIAVFGGKYEGGIHLQQVSDELAPCIKDLLDVNVKIDRYLEIGSAAGGMVFIINHFLMPGNFGDESIASRIVLIDDNQHPKAPLRPVVLAGINHKEIIGNSRDEEIITRAREMGPYDLMMIDADHSYTGVAIDIDNYLSMLNSGGFFILHDAVIGDPWGVPQMVSELMTDKRVEFFGGYTSKKHTPCGIVVFRKVAA